MSSTCLEERVVKNSVARLRASFDYVTAQQKKVPKRQISKSRTKLGQSSSRLQQVALSYPCWKNLALFQSWLILISRQVYPWNGQKVMLD